MYLNFGGIKLVETVANPISRISLGMLSYKYEGQVNIGVCRLVVRPDLKRVVEEYYLCAMKPTKVLRENEGTPMTPHIKRAHGPKI